MDLPTKAELNEHWRATRPNVIAGLIKLKLVHAEGTSLLVPDLRAANLGWMRWFQSEFFTTPLLSFLDGYAAADIGIDVRGGQLLNVRLSKGRFVASLSDTSQVYRCLISGPPDLALYSDGTCSLQPGGAFELNLFHHTTDAAAEAIKDSGHFRGSVWNVQGTLELKNVAYAYFTSLPRVDTKESLTKISMASSGYIELLRTNATSARDVIRLKVNRQSSLDRKSTLPVSVPATLVSSQHVYAEQE